MGIRHDRGHPREPSVLRELARNKRVREAAFDATVILGSGYLLNRGVKVRTTSGGYKQGSRVLRGIKRVPFGEALTRRGYRRDLGESIVRTLRPKYWRHRLAIGGQRRFYQQVNRGFGEPAMPAWQHRKLWRGLGEAKGAAAGPKMSQAEYAAGLGKAKPKRRFWTRESGYK